MGKDSEQNSKRNIRNSLADSHFVRQARYLLKDWDIKVMSYVMIVVVSVAMIAATVAWFTYFHVVAVSNMGFTAADCESLKVEVKKGVTNDGANFVELKEGEEDSVLVDLDMPVFDNVEQYEITVGGTETEEGDQSGSGADSSSGDSTSEESGSEGNGSAGNSSEEDASATPKTVSKMAPGVYGSITIRLTSLNKDVNTYRITPATLFTYINGTSDYVMESGEVGSYATSDTTTTDGETEGTENGAVPAGEYDVLHQLAKGHILFFEDRAEITDGTTSTEGDETTENNEAADDTETTGNNSEIVGDTTISIDANPHNKKYVYYNQIESGACMTGELTWNKESNEGNPVVVTLYWYWPYEYDNLGTTIQDRIKLPEDSESNTSAASGSDTSDSIVNDTRLMYFDKDKMQEIVNNSISWNETQLYDYADTRIGTYVSKIRIHLKVDGYHAAEETSQTTE